MSGGGRQRKQAPTGRCSPVGAIFRLHMGGSALLSWYVAMADSRSLMHLVAETREGAALLWLLMLVGVAALFDSVINDLLPARFHWRVALRQRHFILAALAFCYVAQLYVAFFNLRSTGLLLYYLWNAVTIMAVAFFDAHQRSKDATCSIVCS
ncbi:hypothetical protein ACFSQU_18170 [Massilia sp. GCM10020059]|uniref:Uncharacterized protein n=1 Tax=Massilia agrisoli TaxID=2892444 RepID=A0ABS8ISA2_9BURK|nr:hypothetical protein [Massilia agrisoli]MCC6071469.1 hypothetical protein [Massilia agrisoli]